MSRRTELASPLSHEDSVVGAKLRRQTLSVQSLSRTLRVKDVHAEKHGRPHQKVGFLAASLMGIKFLTPGYPGARVRKTRKTQKQGLEGQAVRVF